MIETSRITVTSFVRFRRALARPAACLLGLLALSACTNTRENVSSFLTPPDLSIGPIGETTKHGYVVSPEALEQVPVGSSRDQVLIALGSPSTTADFGGEVFYYISQTRHKPVEFMTAKVVDQRVLAVYFDEKATVTQIAEYGLQDGRIFDFRTETTPTSGRDMTFIGQILQGGIRRNPFGGGGNQM